MLDIDWEKLTKSINGHYNATFSVAAVKRSYDRAYRPTMLKSLREQFRDLGLSGEQVEAATSRALALPQAQDIQTKAITKAIEGFATKSASRRRRRSDVNDNGYIRRDFAGRRIKGDD